MASESLSERARGIARQAWRDMLSVYYANTPVWRWLKSGALVFLGLFLWTGGNVVLSVKPGWTVLHYVMAYGFLLLLWGPLTHFVVVPLAIRLRRDGESRAARIFAWNSGKINLAIFFALVIVIGTITPGIMLFEFSPSVGDDGTNDVTGNVVCEFGETTVSCEVEDAQGFDHAVVTSGSEQLARVDDPPYAFEVRTENLAETRTGQQFEVTFRDEDGNRIRRFIRTVP